MMRNVVILLKSTILWLLIFVSIRKSLVEAAACSDRLLPGLSDDRLTASSQKSSIFPPTNARLDNVNGYSWCPSSKSNSYIQASMNSLMTVGGIITQGTHYVSAWVTKFNVKYSTDGTNWEYVKDTNGITNRVFNGNFDSNTWVTNMLANQVNLQYVRIYPIAYNYYPCLRFDVLGCQATTEVTTTAEATTTKTEATMTSTEATSTTTEASNSTTTEATSTTPEANSTTKGAVTTIQKETTTEVTTLIAMTESNPQTTEDKSTTKDIGITSERLVKSMTLSSEDYTSSPTFNETSSAAIQSAAKYCCIVCPKNYTERELIDTVEELKKELTTEKKKTSKYIRSKTCASDERRSSATIGYLGIVILSAIGIGIVLLDLPNLVQIVVNIKNLMKN